MRNWIVVGLILFVVGLIGTGVTFGSMGADAFSFGTEKVHKEERAKGQGIQRIKLDTGGADVEIVPGSANEVVGVLDGRASKKFLDRIKLEMTRSGDQLTVNLNASTGFSIGVNILDVDLRLEIPQQQWKQLVIDGGSGNLDMTGIEADTLELDLGSGNVNLGQINAGTVKLEAGSGNVTAEQSEADRISIDVSSGNVKLADITAGKIEAETGSGNIQILADTLASDIAANSGSGNVTLATKDEPVSATIRYSTGSGDLKNEWDGASYKNDDNDDEQTVVFGSGQANIEIETGSGNIYLERR